MGKKCTLSLKRGARTFFEEKFCGLAEGMSGFLSKATVSLFQKSVTLLIQLLHTDVFAGEAENGELTEETGRNAIGVTRSDIPAGEIGVDDYGAGVICAGVYKIVEAGNAELIVLLCTEIVDDQQIAVEITGASAGSIDVTVAVETLVAEGGYKILGCLIYDIKPALDDRSGDGR